MAEHRPFPPSPRRRQLARQAGLAAASPWLVGAAAAAAVVLALGAAGGAVVGRLADAVAAACSGHAALQPSQLTTAVAEAALPVLGAAAVAAVIAQLVQTRAAWLPRRRVAGAPALEAGPLPRTQRAAGAFAAAAVVGGVTFGWLWWAAPKLASLVLLEPRASSPGPTSPLAIGALALAASLASALVVAWLALGVLDALARSIGLARALRMTASEKREDDRLAGADPRWRARRAEAQRSPGTPLAIAGAAVLLLGDGSAAAIAWDPVRRPIPVRIATGRGPQASQLLGLARRHRIAIHRDPALAAALVGDDGPVPEAHWARLAEIIAATRPRGQ